MILVTGGAGYIGSHTVFELIKEGYEVVVLDNLNTGYREFVPRDIPLLIGDILDFNFILDVLKEYSIDAVIHFAGVSLVGESAKYPERYYRINIGGTASLLSAMREAGVRKLIFSSSASVYGIPNEIPISENHPLLPVNPYGESKLNIEKLLYRGQEGWGLGWIALRYFNAAGAHPSGKIGEAHYPETHLIPNILRAAYRGESWTLWGNDYPTPDGTCIRDYIHVCDLATAHTSALKELKEGQGEIYNVGTGKGHSNKEILEETEKLLGFSIPCQIGPRRPGDPPILVAKASLIREKFNWSPQYSNIKMIIESAWAWYKDGGKLVEKSKSHPSI